MIDRLSITGSCDFKPTKELRDFMCNQSCDEEVSFEATFDPTDPIDPIDDLEVGQEVDLFYDKEHVLCTLQVTNKTKEGVTLKLMKRTK